MVSYEQKKHNLVKKAVDDKKSITIVRSPNNINKPLGFTTDNSFKNYSNKQARSKQT
jgi:hypothetical protein